MNKSILISGIGGPTPRSIALRLRELYPGAHLVGVDTNPKALGFYMDGLLDKGLVIPRAHHKDYWNNLETIINDEGIDLAFVQPEKEVIAWGNYYKENGSYPSPALIPPVEYAESLVNKAAMAEMLEGTEYIPKTVRLDSKDPDFGLIDSKIGYPCWIRASEGSGGLGSLKLTGERILRPGYLFIRLLKSLRSVSF